ncbi:hypothetical protein M8C21_016663, partial [Ambrosia artemisiifolia]
PLHCGVSLGPTNNRNVTRILEKSRDQEYCFSIWRRVWGMVLVQNYCSVRGIGNGSHGLGSYL